MTKAKQETKRCPVCRKVVKRGGILATTWKYGKRRMHKACYDKYHREQASK